jgi:phosphatidylglycerol:prolipoprotein diacylglycerol transferase
MLPYFSVFGFEIYTYPLVLGIAWAVGYHFSEFLIKLKNLNIKNFKLYFALIFLMSWLGAKSFFLLTINREASEAAFKNTNFWLGGGFVFYGGLIFAIFTTLVYAKIKSIPIQNFRFCLPAVALGHGLGRIGCMLAGCCYGTVTDCFLSVELHGHERHPVQLYESMGLLILAYICYRRYKMGRELILFYIVSYSILRFITEFFRGDMIRGVYSFGLSTSQIISVVFITLAFVFYLLSKKYPIIK